MKVCTSLSFNPRVLSPGKLACLDSRSSWLPFQATCWPQDDWRVWHPDRVYSPWMWVAYNRARRIITLAGPLSPSMGPFFSPPFQCFGSTEALRRLCPFHKPDHKGSSCVATLSHSLGPGGRSMRGWAHFKAISIKSMLHVNEKPRLSFPGRSWHRTKI